ncbi:MAG: TraR/DksA family transcriptional regulator [Desulfobacterota bacterium]|nr:TraR/DksA family transcriptional regulator [Thermodesulfobacteriota bacterium]MDW8002189.1 TraR/DksA family transcriptional regulator [Deltaproteobacteria bacterium]
MDKEKLLSFKKRLLKMREDIVNKSKRLKDDSLSIGTDGIQDMADAASNTYNVDILMSLSDNDMNLLKDIDTALDKIEKGLFGICEECEEPINEKRLEVNPTARYCINCQRMIEMKGM